MDYREPPWADDKYAFSKTFWHVVAAQFIFIFIFEVTYLNQNETLNWHTQTPNLLPGSS